jgi:hypothetical protein
MRDPEYDRFGPWILEITEADPLPPLFVPAMTRTEEPLFCVKIPRPMDRRDLSPGMNMYDYVVALYDDDFLVLERVGTEVIQLSFSYQDILAIRHAEDLLDGNLHIYLAEKSYNIPYSTVSAGLVEKQIELIRDRYQSGTSYTDAGTEAPLSAADTENLSFYFSGLLKKSRSSHPNTRLLAVQTEIAVHTVNDKFWRRLFYGAIDKRLLESIHLYNGCELEIVSRGRKWSYRWQVIYGKETLYLPLEKLKAIQKSPEKNNPGIESVELETDGSSHVFLFVSGNPALREYPGILNNGVMESN